MASVSSSLTSLPKAEKIGFTVSIVTLVALVALSSAGLRSNHLRSMLKVDTRMCIIAASVSVGVLACALGVLGYRVSSLDRQDYWEPSRLERIKESIARLSKAEKIGFTVSIVTLVALVALSSAGLRSNHLRSMLKVDTRVCIIAASVSGGVLACALGVLGYRVSSLDARDQYPYFRKPSKVEKIKKLIASLPTAEKIGFTVSIVTLVALVALVALSSAGLSSNHLRSMLKVDTRVCIIAASVSVGVLACALGVLGYRSITAEAANAKSSSDFAVAIQAGDEAEVKALIDAGAKVNAVNSLGYTPLHYAALQGDPSMINALLEAGANVNAADKRGWRALYLAASKGWVEIVQILLERGAKVDAVNNKGETALIVASAQAPRNLEETVTALINEGANPNHQDSTGQTALHFIASRGYPSIVKFLLNAHAKVDVVDTRNGSTPLHFATCYQKGNLKETVEALIKAGANVTRRNSTNRSALHFAAGWHNPDTVRALLEAGADIEVADKLGWRALQLAALEGSVENVRILLERGAEVDAVGSEGATALISAARCRYRVKNTCFPWVEPGEDTSEQKQILEMLLEAGADVNATDNLGYTALHWAARAGHATILEMLLEAGANRDIRDNDGHTSFDLIRSGHYAVPYRQCRSVLEKKSKPDLVLNQVGQGGQTPLQRAANDGDEAKVARLLAAGADVNCANGKGSVALHWAARAGDVTILEMLLDAQADVNAANKDGQTALHYAAYGGHARVLEMLLQAGADMNAKNSQRRTAYSLISTKTGESYKRCRALLKGSSKTTPS